MQSLINLVELLRRHLSIFVFCSAQDMGDTSILPLIQPNTWNQLKENLKVFYVKDAFVSNLRSAISYSKPEVVYINGVFMPEYNLLPLWFAKRKKIKIVIAPRGMLQKGALAIRPVKKKFFLRVFKILQLHKEVTWHATDIQESKDIKKIFGDNADVVIAGNIPKPSSPSITFRRKVKGQLKMIYLSLISEKKNLHLILEALTKIKTPVEFDIYGPIKDKVYWNKCQRLMESQIHNIRYAGIVHPDDVLKTLSGYHVFVLPTSGENFGHAIYEALNAGTPAILSKFTPWGSLQDQHGGITIELDQHSMIEAIQDFIFFDDLQFSNLSLSAHNLAKKYYFENDYKRDYLKLFS